MGDDAGTPHWLAMDVFDGLFPAIAFAAIILPAPESHAG